MELDRYMLHSYHLYVTRIYSSNMHVLIFKGAARDPFLEDWKGIEMGSYCRDVRYELAPFQGAMTESR